MNTTSIKGQLILSRHEVSPPAPTHPSGGATNGPLPKASRRTLSTKRLNHLNPVLLASRQATRCILKPPPHPVVIQGTSTCKLSAVDTWLPSSRRSACSTIRVGGEDDLSLMRSLDEPRNRLVAINGPLSRKTGKACRDYSAHNAGMQTSRRMRMMRRSPHASPTYHAL